MTAPLEPDSLRFIQRPAPVLPEHRIFYKLTQLMLVLKLGCRGGQSSLAKLHLFNWALKSPDRMAKLVNAAERKRLDVLAWGFDPALAHALRFALAGKLVIQSKGSFVLTDLGSAFIARVVDDEDSFIEPKHFFSTVGKAITESMVETVSKGWEY